MSILNILIVVTGTVKIFYYVRVFEGMGQIVELLEQCLIDMITFTSFFIFLIIIYGILYLVGGVNPNLENNFEGMVIYWI